MKFTFSCPECHEQLEADASMSGSRTPCPKCQSALHVPDTKIGPGVTLGGFEIEGILGRGGMGTVYLARQLSMDRQVALKVLAPALTADEQFVQRFLHEVRTLAKIEHPHIVTAHEAGEDAGHYFLAMSYVPGESLDIRVKRGGPLPEPEALRIVRCVATTLDYAWRKNRLLHRDIKPANVMVDRDGEVKLMDLGISKSFAEETGLTLTGAMVGTPCYMSPEQARNVADLDFRADMYSLGGTLYHLVTGTVPFKGSSSAEVVSQVLRDPLPPPEEKNPDISPGCSQLIRVMMAKEPELRHPSWDSLVQDVDRVTRGELPTIPPPGPDQSTVVGRTPPPTAIDRTQQVDKTVQMPQTGARAAPGQAGRRRSSFARRAALVCGAALLFAAAAGVGIRWRRRKAAAAAAPPPPPQPAEARQPGAGQHAPEQRFGGGRMVKAVWAQKRRIYDIVADSLVRRDFAHARLCLDTAKSRLPAGTSVPELKQLEHTVSQVEGLLKQVKGHPPKIPPEARHEKAEGGAKDEILIVRGLLAYKAGQLETAREFFRAVEAPIGPALVAHTIGLTGGGAGARQPDWTRPPRRGPGRSDRPRPAHGSGQARE